MEPSYGKEHEYLGMKIKITDDRKLEINMSNQIEEIVEGFSEEIGGKVSSPATRTLMDVDTEAPKLDEARAVEFHSTTAKLLHLEKRGRPDMETVVALTFLYQTKNDVRVIGCDSLKGIFTWIDAAYAVHPNMRSQTGGIISLGWGALHAKSSKQKLNTKSSTEAEIVGVSQYIPYNLWLINFLKHQGYGISQNVVYQDNQSAIKMEKNGRNS